MKIRERGVKSWEMGGRSVELGMGVGPSESAVESSSQVEDR